MLELKTGLALLAALLRPSTQSSGAGVWSIPSESPRQAARLYSWMIPPRRSRRSTGPRRQGEHVGRLTGSALLNPLVRTGLVVVVDKLHQHALQVPAGEDQHPV